MSTPESTLDPSLLSREKEFHDDWAESVAPQDVLVKESFEAATAPEGRLASAWLGNVQNKELLDLGCGCGEAAVYFALKGARVTALDLSPGMLTTTREVAKFHGTTVTTCEASGDILPFADNSFDIVYAANVLHHVALEQTLIEIKRVLRPGGVLLSWDPLRHNPIINLYRRLATKVRTEDETPLSIDDLAVFRKHFTAVQHATTWLTTLWIFMQFFLIERVHPNKERYWKKIIVEHKRLESTHRRLERMDNWLLSSFPWLQRMCWNIVVLATK
jgi:ubiquinone/menaquinone biosynthesis C-methylase UbiE